MKEAIRVVDWESICGSGTATEMTERMHVEFERLMEENYERITKKGRLSLHG